MLMVLFKQLAVFITVFFLSVSSVNAISLEQAVKDALQTNPELLEQNQQFLISEHRIDQASSAYKPSLDLRAATGRQRTKSTFSTGGKEVDLTPIESSLVLTQPLFEGFKTTHDVASSEAAHRAERLQTFTKAEQISLQVAQAYLNVLKTEEIVKLAEKNLKVHDELYQQIKRRFDKGASDKADMTQVEGRIALANSNFLASLNNFEDAKANFEAVAGFPAADFTRPSVDASLVPATKDQALTIAAREHPQILSSRESVKSAQENFEGSKSPYMPKLDLELSGRWNEDDNGVKGTNNELSALVVLNWNLYQGGLNSAQRKVALSQMDASKSASNRVLRQVLQEIKLAYAALESTRRQKRFRQEHVVFSKESRRLYQLQFDAGKRTLLDVLNTENEVFNSSTAYVESDYAYISAQYRILTATGRMLTAVNLRTPWSSDTNEDGKIQ